MITQKQTNNRKNFTFTSEELHQRGKKNIECTNRETWIRISKKFRCTSKSTDWFSISRDSTNFHSVEFETYVTNTVVMPRIGRHTLIPIYLLTHSSKQKVHVWFHLNNSPKSSVVCNYANRCAEKKNEGIKRSPRYVVYAVANAKIQRNRTSSTQQCGDKKPGGFIVMPS